MTDPRSACPPDRNVTCFGQLQNALVGRLPVRGDAAARERYQRAGVGVVLGHVSCSHRCADDTRGPRLTAVEKFEVNLPLGDADGGERLLHVGHECCGPADVDICVARESDRIEDRSRHVTGHVEILTLPVVRARPAVANIEATIREHRHERADFRDERMMLPIACRMQPQHLPCRASRRQRVQHREHRRRSNSRAEQYDRPLAFLQDKVSARRADVERVTDTDMLVQVASSRAVRLEFHADPISLGRWESRERVAAKQRLAAGLWKTQDDVLSRAAPPTAPDRPDCASSARERLLIPGRPQSPQVAGIRAPPDAPPRRRLVQRCRFARRPTGFADRSANARCQPGESASIRRARSSSSRG